MDFLWLALIAVVSGVFAGMGMGGGTFLIPLLTIFMNISAPVAQCTNLLVFVPMAVITIIIYARQKLIDFSQAYIVSIPACLVSAVGALVSVNISSRLIKILFGAFIALIGVIQIIVLIVKFIRKKRKNQ